MTTTTDRRVVEIDVKTARGMQEELKRAADSVKSLEKGFGSLKSIVAEFGAGLVAGLSVGAFVSSVKSTIDAMEALGERSQSVGVTTEALSALSYQAKQTSISTEQLDVGLVKLSKNLDDMGNESTGATKALERLGVVAGTDTETALTQIADMFQSMPDGAEKTALAVEIFGKAGAKLIPMLNDGSEGMEKFRKELEAMGGVISGEAAAAAGQLNDELGALQQGVGGMITQIALGLLPALLQIVEAFKGVTSSGDTMKSWGETIGTVLKFASAQAINIAGAFEALGRIIGGVTAAMSRAMRADFRGAMEIAKELGNDLRQLDIDINKKLAKLETPVVVAARQQGTAAAGERQESDAERAKRDREAERAAKERQKDIEKANKSWVESIDLQIELAKAEGLAANNGKSMTQVLEDQQKVLDQMTGRAAAKKFAADLALLDQAYQDFITTGGAMGITWDEYVKGLQRITGATEDATKTVGTDFEELGKSIQQSIEGWSGDAADAVLDFATGAEQDISKMAENIIRTFAKMALQKMVFDNLFKAVGGMFAPAADGAAFGHGGQRLALASGGVVTGPTPFAFAGGAGIMGEAGPEAILPLKRNAAGQLGVAGGGGDVTVNVINQASGVDVDVQRSANGEREVSILIQQAVSDGFARGRFDGVMGATYGLNRRGR